jgi:hypothetical protein
VAQVLVLVVAVIVQQAELLQVMVAMVFQVAVLEHQILLEVE